MGVKPEDIERAIASGNRVLAQLKKVCPDYEDRSPKSNPKSKPAICHEPLAETTREETNPRRFRVCVVSFRRRITDPDNICPKYFVDCLRYSEIIPDDSCKEIELVVRQQKVKHRCDERTELFVDRF